MGQFLAFSVEVLDDRRLDPTRIADFSRLPAAIRACKLALQDERTKVALVKNREGVMVYCADRRREWPSDSLYDSAETPVSPSSGTGGPDIEDEPDLAAYRRHGLVLFLCYLAAAWIETPV